ncbi:hypothetical protein D3C74_381200 [compost metagenome]
MEMIMEEPASGKRISYISCVIDAQQYLFHTFQHPWSKLKRQFVVVNLPCLQPDLLRGKLQVIAVEPSAPVLRNGACRMRGSPLGRSCRTSGIFPE